MRWRGMLLPKQLQGTKALVLHGVVRRLPPSEKFTVFFFNRLEIRLNMDNVGECVKRAEAEHWEYVRKVHN